MLKVRWQPTTTEYGLRPMCVNMAVCGDVARYLAQGTATLRTPKTIWGEAAVIAVKAYITNAVIALQATVQSKFNRAGSAIHNVLNTVINTAYRTINNLTGNVILGTAIESVDSLGTIHGMVTGMGTGIFGIDATSAAEVSFPALPAIPATPDWPKSGLELGSRQLVAEAMLNSMPTRQNAQPQKHLSGRRMAESNFGRDFGSLKLGGKGELTKILYGRFHTPEIASCIWRGCTG